MRSRELLLAVKEMLTEAMKEDPFPTPDGSCEDLQVFLHGLPDEQGRRTYPFICVRWVSGDINEGVDGYIGAEGRETLALVLGMYAPESQEQAGLILAELLDWTRAVLRRNRAFMNQSFFKEILEQEIHSVFLTPAEFGESVTLEGKTLDAVVDRPEMAWPEADDRPGVSHKLVVLLVALSDFPDELYPGTSVTFNGERWFVATADREALRTIRLYREAA